MIAGGGKGNLLERVSATAQGSDPEETAGTVVHELGHNQGLPHVACPYASASSPEPDYPYTDGLIGAWGYGLVSGALYDPAHHWDYMSYCNPSWVSPWSWALTQQRIVRLTSWNEARGGLRPLVVAATTELPGGARHSYWFVARGDAPDHPDQGDHPDQARRIELHAAGEPLASLPAQLVHASDPATTWLVAELPAAYAQLEGVDALVGVDGRARAFTARREQVVLPSPGGYQR
nr:M66 family metalloprotease [Pseudenhygromyxa sp. WMMC2535]